MPPPRAAASVLLLLGMLLAGCAAPGGGPGVSPAEEPPSGGHPMPGHGMPGMGNLSAEGLDRGTAGLPAAQPSRTERLAAGQPFELRAGLVAFDAGLGAPIRMLAYNGQIPGPTLRMPQGAAIVVEFHNDLPFETTVHWHGLRLDAAMDGVPGLSQAPVPPGGTFRYELRTPDEGVFWYHAHVREDLQQELGLAGLLVVEGPEQQLGQGPRDVPLVLDDLALREDRRDVAPYSLDRTNRTLMGRYGDVYLVHGQRSWTLDAAPGERVRLLVLDAANARPFRLQVVGAAAAQWIASDAGYFDAPRDARQVVLGPGERAVLDVVMPAEGDVTLYNRPTLAPNGFVPLGTLRAAGAPAVDAGAPPGPHARARASLAPALAHAQDPVQVTWELDMHMDMRAFATVSHQHGGPQAAIEWEDIHASMNALSDDRNVAWIVRDAATRAEGMDASYAFPQGSWVKVQVRNLASSMHPMQHPIHLHGQRFVVAAVDGQANPDPAWKDTVLVPTGSSVDLVVEMSNPGRWLYHCHISEHMGAGMMGAFTVA